MTTHKGKPLCVTVYASSSAQVADIYKNAARELGEAIAKEGWIQLNGGGRTGLMGAATEGGKEKGGVVKACILDIFVDNNQHHLHDHVAVACTMTERKTGLFDPADAFVALPGGLGTLEELAEVLSWRQLAIHEKPIVIMNVQGYWDPVLTFIKTGQAEGFISSKFSSAMCVASSPEEAINFIKNFEPTPMNKREIHNGEMNADWTQKQSSSPAVERKSNSQS